MTVARLWLCISMSAKLTVNVLRSGRINSWAASTYFTSPSSRWNLSHVYVVRVVGSVVTIHRCIDVSRYLSRDMYRDTVCNNRDTRDLATFLRFLLECLTDINCQSAKNYQCRMSSHPQQTAGSYSQLKSIKLCRMSVISNKWSYD